MKINCSKSQLKKVGEKLRHGCTLSEQEETILAEFRSGHRKILKAFRRYHDTLHKSSRWKTTEILFASRLKKRDTLIHKLRSRYQQMDLSRMNDVAGCRFIFQTQQELNAYRKEFIKRLERNKHFIRLHAGQYDYSKSPSPTGYRGIHDVYEEKTEDRVKAKIEVQYRTLTQHSWATSLEIWDQIHSNGVNGAKFGRENPRIQNLFCLYSELLWRTFDCQNGNWGMKMTNKKLYDAIQKEERELKVFEHLSQLEQEKIKIWPKLDTVKDLILIFQKCESFMPKIQILPKDVEICSELLNAEVKNKDDTVFIQINPKILTRAYNNFFRDPHLFIKKVKVAMKKLYDDQKYKLFRKPLDKIFQ